MKAVRPEVTIVGVQTNDSDAMAQSVKTGERLQLENVGLAAEGTAVKEVGVGAFRLASALVDDFVLVDTDAARATIKDVFEDARTVLEPSGALAVAGAKPDASGMRAKDRTPVAIRLFLH